jgi:hypothetical protein
MLELLAREAALDFGNTIAEDLFHNYKYKYIKNMIIGKFNFEMRTKKR